MKIGFTSGVFDLFHIGHLNLLKNARLKCDYLIVGVCSDKLAFELKQKKPVIYEQHRLEIVSSLKVVDQVFLKQTDDDVILARKHSASVIFKGSDWFNSVKWRQNKELMQFYNQKLVFLPYTKGISSTQIKEKLK